MRIDDKIEEIKRYAEEIKEFLPTRLKTYLEDNKTRAACERYFEKIVEATIDAAFLVAKERGLKTPDEEKKIFDLLNEENLVPDNLCTRLKEAKGMRNIIAHQYGSVDDELVFHAITEDLLKDVEEFLECIDYH